MMLKIAMLTSSTEDWDSMNARTLITIFYSTGMRLAELLNLKDAHIDLPRKTVKVLGKGNKERMIPLIPAAIDVIRTYQSQKKKVFERTDDRFLVTPKGRKLYPRYAYNLVNKYLSQVKTLDKKSPHVLRVGAFFVLAWLSAWLSCRSTACRPRRSPAPTG